MLHGVARVGLATIFPRPIGITASFSPESVYEVSSVVSDETCTKNADYASQRNHVRYQGLIMWTPTVDIYHDPRWGRGIETHGKGPYFTSRMSIIVVKNLQGTNDGEYDKLHACTKYFTIHSEPKWNRHSFSAEDLSTRDLYETYLPPFGALVKKVKMGGVMCTYNGFEEEPCCDSNRLLTQIPRSGWGFNGIIFSDCGVIADFHNGHGYKAYPDAESASTIAMLSDMDLEYGSSYKTLTKAVHAGQINGKGISRAVMCLLEARSALGGMDDLDNVSWIKIPFFVVASVEHNSLALNMTRKSTILLQNMDNILPLKRDGLIITAMGPSANDSVAQ